MFLPAFAGVHLDYRVAFQVSAGGRLDYEVLCGSLGVGPGTPL